MMKKVAIFTFYLLFFWVCLPAILIFSSVYLERRFDLERFDSLGLKVIGALIILIAVPMLAIAIIQFKKFGKKYPISANPPTAIIQKGLFAVWRHPIYLFYSLTFIALSLIWGSRTLLFVVFPIFLMLEALYIIIEEKMLIKRFGDTYRHYQRRTRLIIPRTNAVQALFFKILFKVLFDYKVINKDRIPDRGPYFVVSAHRNYLDPFFIGCAIPHLIRFVTTYEMFRNRKIGWYFKAMKCIPKKRYLKDMNTGREIVRAIRKEDVIGIFPEGERSWTGTVNEIKPETLNLFYKYPNIPILPVKLKGNYHAWPRWRKRMGKSKLSVDIQDPIYVDLNSEKEKFEARLRQAIDPEDVDNKEFYCQPGNKADDITIVLYRCPDCRNFDVIQIVGRNECACSYCSAKIIVNEKFQLNIDSNEGLRNESLDAIYQQIRVDQSDIKKRATDTYPKGFNKALLEGEYLITFAKDCIFFKENGTGFQPLETGYMLLTNRRILFNNGGDDSGLSLDDIDSVTIEGYKKIQLYNYRQRELYQVIVHAESALKWQDFIATTIQKVWDRIPNTK